MEKRKLGLVLYKYLLKNRLTDKYINNIKDSNRTRFSDFLEARKDKKLLIDFLSNNIISEAFIWAETKEGYAFWYNHSINLHKEFDKLITEKNSA